MDHRTSWMEFVRSFPRLFGASYWRSYEDWVNCFLGKIPDFDSMWLKQSHHILEPLMFRDLGNL